MSDGEEVFHLFGRAWNVSAIQRAILRGEVEAREARCEIAQAKSLLGFIRIDPAHVPRVDLAEPVLGVQQSLGVLIIDGWHRIARALREGVADLPMVVVPDEERWHA